MSNPTHVAVTGAAGYIGSRVLTQLQRDHPDWELTAIDNFYLGQTRSVGDVDIQHVDIRHRDQLEAALEGADVVLHLAAISGVDDCSENKELAYEVNVQGTANVAWVCQEHGAAMAFPFSMAVVGDPTAFPITVDMARDPLNWYGKTKVLGESLIDDFAQGSFPAHQYMISNLYGGHVVNGEEISKGTVINFFVNRALAGEPLTVYEPGTQARNFVHVKDVANAFCLSVERLAELQAAGETGVQKFEIASDEDPSVMAMAELVQSVAAAERDREVEVKLVENPRSAETLVDEFRVDTAAIEAELGWEPRESIEATVRELLATE
jgi:nucleoside-diphosphate-sugar epimerase